MQNHYMIDIETTGVDKKNDDILEIALVEVEFTDYWRPTGKVFHERLYSERVPQNIFAKENMTELYKACNEIHVGRDYSWCADKLQNFLHGHSHFSWAENKPEFFMGWNASNFDIPFLYEKRVAVPSYYNEDNQLRGDIHYRIYEQTGALQLTCDNLMLDRKTVQAIAESVNPGGITLPEGKSHDALYDCYWQIQMMNGLIWMGRNWPKGELK